MLRWRLVDAGRSSGEHHINCGCPSSFTNSNKRRHTSGSRRWRRQRYGRRRPAASPRASSARQSSRNPAEGCLAIPDVHGHVGVPIVLNEPPLLVRSLVLAFCAVIIDNEEVLGLSQGLAYPRVRICLSVSLRFSKQSLSRKRSRVLKSDRAVQLPPARIVRRRARPTLRRIYCSLVHRRWLVPCRLLDQHLFPHGLRQFCAKPLGRPISFHQASMAG